MSINGILTFKINRKYVFIIYFSGTFRWTDERNNVFLREVMVIESYKYKVGSGDAGRKWKEVADKMNSYAPFKSAPCDQRSVREHFNKLIVDFKRKNKKEVASSGESPEPLSGTEQMLEEIVEIMNSPPDVSQVGSKKEDDKRKNALLCREQAMKTWSKSRVSQRGSEEGDSSEEEISPPSAKRRTRRGGSDGVRFLAKKAENETELKKQELELRKEELRAQAEQQREQLKLQQEQLKLMFDFVTKFTKQ